jgi:putative ABC transport system permease protein
MFKTYLTIALRKLSRERGYALLNVVSLSLGIASAILILLYVRSEFTHDHYHRDYEHIYRLSGRIQNADGAVEDQALVGPGVGPLITHDFPQLGVYTRFQSAWEIVMRVGDTKRLWETVYFVDPSFYDVFTHEAVYGDAKDAASDPSAVAVSESFARFYFGDRNPVGEAVTLENGMHLAIAYVFKDLPDNVHLRYDVLTSSALLDRIMPGYTANYARTLSHPYVHTFLKVPADFDAGALGAIARRFIEARSDAQMRQNGMSFSLLPQRLDRIHFEPQLSMDLPAGNVVYAYGFAAVGCFILLVACINYVNLACARALKRAKEIGMRRVVGATQRQLILQFLAEAGVVTLASVLIAVALVYAALSMTTLGGLMGKERLLAALSESSAILWIAGLAVFVSLAAGSYPAFYLAGISPLAALTTARTSWRRGLSVRNALLLVQLTVAVAVIATTLAMMQQMRYVHTKPLGFERQNRVIVTVRRYDIVKQMAAIRAELRKQPGVLDVTTIANVPGVSSWELPCGVETNAATMENVSVRRMAVGANFHEAMRLGLIAGRGFDTRLASDTAESVIVNESLVKRMGWSSPLGKRITGPCVGDGHELRVVGVVHDFHYGSLYNLVGPMVLSQLSDIPVPPAPTDEGVYAQSFIVVVAGTDLRRTMDAIERAVRQFDRSFEFEPVFLEDVIAAQYRTESNVMKLMGLFAAVCIGISIIGILGLTAFATEHRTKEIGIRKVLGASDMQVVLMFGRPVLLLVLLAAVPACYFSYRAITLWLERFAYRVDLGPMTFVLATGWIAVAAAAAVAVQSLRAARANPIDSLRYE